ncbi:hypothetical protein CAOG_06761 [Capsaspora owczarzaki ATCC 30864]|uniref:Ser/Thr-rich protein T10 in DGCR region n=1 Tax=Capsaspora owczarzaki (strain ATCC 30864) TaxID=595528 RepID=A0A0D2X4P8_CAPO3|nr:hypothetical protein CAOG_06761 [Capsaspora owczarzaki ATCC 30864]KJE96434.1 hypothetical protein, variant 1 [Capsaspora owczarzaki ATCC 30864]|eukprot:XP_004344382.1 hypothetical protein CAOG_06761 [Capsaspora owczarzaki ATCC 30864]
MCIVFFKACAGGPQCCRFRFVMAANRDEFFNRPTDPAHFWKEAPHVLGGIDREPGREGGTWLGTTTDGRVAFLTNCREASPPPELRGRGGLCANFLVDQQASPDKFAHSLASERHEFSGFNLVVGDIQSGNFQYVSNRVNQDYQSVQPCVLHGVSNGVLDEPWPKVTRGKANIDAAVNRANADADQVAAHLASAMRDQQKCSDDQLPKTGVPIEWERKLSPVFVEFPEAAYGTRSIAVQVVDHNGHSVFYEHTRDSETGEWKQQRFSFSLNDEMHS